MKIDRKNYEVFFLDYLEGSLSTDKEAMLHQFLEENPDLAQEIEAFDMPLLEPQAVSLMPQKAKLKKTQQDVFAHPEFFDDFCIARIEGDLSLQQGLDFARFMNENPEKQEQAQRYEYTKLKADTSIVYPKKRALKQYVLPMQTIYRSMAVAASLALLFLAWWGWTENQQITFAEKTEQQYKQVPVDSSEDSDNKKTTINKKANGVLEPEEDIANDKNVLPEKHKPHKQQQYLQPDNGLQGENEELLAELQRPEHRLPASSLHKSFDHFSLLPPMSVPALDADISGDSPMFPIGQTEIAHAQAPTRKTPKQIDPVQTRHQFWNLAETGVVGICQLTGNQAVFDTRRDDAGRLVGFKFETENFGISKKIR